MTKEVILLSIPHSGTHTWFKLLSLAGLPVWWGHFEETGKVYLDRLLSLNLDDYVLVATSRDPETIVQSHLRRILEGTNPPGPRAAEEQVRRTVSQCQQLQHQFTHNLDFITAKTDGSQALRIAALNTILQRAKSDILVSEIVLDFITEWPKLNEWKGDREPVHAIKQTMGERHINQLYKERFPR